MIYSDQIQTLVTKITGRFSEVWHSAEIVSIYNEGKLSERFPGVAQGNDWINLSPTDTKEILYIRRNGDDTIYHEARLGSCTKAYLMKTPLRIVYFKAKGNQGRALFDIMQSVLINAVFVTGIVRDKFKLMRDESTGSYNFNADTVYVAVDVYVVWDFFPDTCETDFCATLPNPVKMCEPITETS